MCNKREIDNLQHVLTTLENRIKSNLDKIEVLEKRVYWLENEKQTRGHK